MLPGNLRIIERCALRPESEIIAVLANPEAGMMLDGQPFYPECGDGWRSSCNEASLRGELAIDAETYDVSIIVTFPGFFARWIASRKRQDPNANLSITMTRLIPE